MFPSHTDVIGTVLIPQYCYMHYTCFILPVDIRLFSVVILCIIILLSPLSCSIIILVISVPVVPWVIPSSVHISIRILIQLGTVFSGLLPLNRNGFTAVPLPFPQVVIFSWLRQIMSNTYKDIRIPTDSSQGDMHIFMPEVEGECIVVIMILSELPEHRDAFLQQHRLGLQIIHQVVRAPVVDLGVALH